MEKRLPVVAGLAVALAAAAIVAGSVWVRIVVLVAVIVVWDLMLRYLFGLPWSRITRCRETDLCREHEATSGMSAFARAPALGVMP